MALDLWQTRDIKHILAGIEAAFEMAHNASGEANEEHQRGVRDAILAMAKAFGLEVEAKGR